jgi:hypothetical protein
MIVEDLKSSNSLHPFDAGDRLIKARLKGCFKNVIRLI